MLTAAVPHPATNPGPLDVVLNQAAYPSDIDNWNSISKDPSFCPVCCNLFAGSALHIIPRPDIYMHETTGLRNAMAAKAKMHQEGHDADEIDRVPEWAGKYRADYASWQFLASSTDMKARAEKGCSSCWILLNGVERLSDESPPELKIEYGQDFEAEIIFCKGNVLRVQVYRMEEVAMADSMLGFMDAKGRSGPAIMLCEFYTLPGKRISFNFRS
jgi:hypothetical protein